MLIHLPQDLCIYVTIALCFGIFAMGWAKWQNSRPYQEKLAAIHRFCTVKQRVIFQMNSIILQRKDLKMFLRNQEKTNKSTNNSAENTESKRDAKKRIKRARIAQNVIRYKEMLENGICCMDDDLYSRAVKFTDINYQIAPNEMKEQIIGMYSDFLQSLGNDIDVSLVINNRLLNREEFEKTLLCHIGQMD